MSFSKPSVSDIISEWLKHPQSHFENQSNSPFEWSTAHGSSLNDMKDSHGLSTMPDIVCICRKGKYSVTIGWIGGITMYEGGTVIVQHFALTTDLTRKGIGLPFFESILLFLKSHNAIRVEFQENHSSKINDYRTFFTKNGIPEIRNCVWFVDLYSGASVPKHVSEYQNSLVKPDC